MKPNHVGLIAVTVVVFALMVPAQSVLPQCGTKSDMDFQIVTDKLIYSPKSMVHVKFLVANTDYTQKRVLHLYRLVSDCSSQMGQYRLTLLDKNNNWVPMQECSADVLMDKVDALEVFTNPVTGIALKVGEVFGSEEDVLLPPKKGTYRLKAELFPAAFNEKQRQALLDKQVRVLPGGCIISAPVVTITIK